MVPLFPRNPTLEQISKYVLTIEQWVDFSFAVFLGKQDNVFREALEIAFIKIYDFCRRSTTELQTSRSFYRVAFFPRKPLSLKTIS